MNWSLVCPLKIGKVRKWGKYFAPETRTGKMCYRTV